MKEEITTMTTTDVTVTLPNPPDRAIYDVTLKEGVATCVVSPGYAAVIKELARLEARVKDMDIERLGNDKK